MNRLEFLKKSLEWGCYRKSEWMTLAFAETREPEGSWQSNKYPGRIISEPWGYSYLDESLTPVKIPDAPKGQSLFQILEEITVDPSWLPNISAPTVTLVGSLLVNAILLVENFGKKIPFIPENITISNIERYVIEHRTDAQEDPEKITLREYLRMDGSIEYLKTLTSLSVYSLTEKNIVPPPGLEDFKKQLIKEYGDRLNDPVVLAEFEDRLKKFDDEYMKGDPSNGKLVAGKIKNNSRRKLFLSSGAEGGLKGDMVPVTESLMDGVPLNPTNFTALVNGSRSGSYFRGVDTVKGGVSFKILIRVLSSFEVVAGDCKTMQGLELIYTKFNIETLVGRRLAGPNGKLIENISEANNYLGQKVKVRSVTRCKSPGQTFCEVCAGTRLSRFKQGLAVPATDMTSTILAASMAAMHKNTTTTTRLKLFDALS